jgi:hypothetical protein
METTPFIKVSSQKDDNGVYTMLEATPDFPKGGVCVFRTYVTFNCDVQAQLSLPSSYSIETAMQDLLLCLETQNNQSEYGLKKCLENLELEDFNVLLYRSEEEERDATSKLKSSS